MKISEVSAKFNLPRETLRYYEQIGLLEKINKKSGIREYEEKDLERIQFIKCMKHTGLSLEDIKKFIDLNKEGDKTLSSRLEILEKQKNILFSEIETKKETLKYLNYKINLYRGKMKK